MANATNSEIVFSREIGSLILEILKKNGVNETTDEVFAKIEKKQSLNGEAVRLMVEDITMGISRKEDLSSLIQKKLGVPQEKAEKIAKEVGTDILPLAERVLKQEEKPPEKINPSKIEPKGESPSSFIKKAPVISVEETEKKPIDSPNKFRPKITSSNRPKPSRSDTYRELIE